jgi:hypothetical protein
MNWRSEPEGIPTGDALSSWAEPWRSPEPGLWREVPHLVLPVAGLVTCFQKVKTWSARLEICIIRQREVRHESGIFREVVVRLDYYSLESITFIKGGFVIWLHCSAKCKL